MKGFLFFTQSQKLGLTLFAGLLAVAILAVAVFTLSNTEKATSVAVSNPETVFEPPDLPQDSPLRLDINLADSTDWIQLRGIGEVLAARIVRYRQSIGGFQSVDDLAHVYRLEASVLETIRPQLYVDVQTIPSTHSRKRAYESQATGYQGPKMDVNTASAEELAKLPGIGTVLSQRIVKFREKKGGYTSVNEVSRVYQLSPDVFADIRPHLTISDFITKTDTLATMSLASGARSGAQEDLSVRGTESERKSEEKPESGPALLPGSININTADSATLVRVPGIGPVLSVRIMKYRKLLGFYASTDLLQHVYGMNEENLLRMMPYLTVGDPSTYPKRDLNTAYSRALAFYPFLGQELANVLLQHRRNLGRFDSWEEVAQVPGMTEEALEGLQQYFHL